METYRLKLDLKSDATFGRGDGVAGLVDAEVEHDRYGLPYLRGRTLKGLLSEECANMLFSIEHLVSPEGLKRWYEAAQRLFGRPGSTLDDSASLHIGDARLPADLRTAVIDDLESRRPPYNATDVLDSLTVIRRQTAMDSTGKPDKGSLRAMRVVLRETPFEAELHFVEPPSDDALALLAVCAMAVRRVGTGRNRGRGRVIVRLCNAQGDDITDTHSERFQQEVCQ